MPTADALSRFHALPVTAAIAAAVDCTFADVDSDDLVHAHLRNNPLYFGGIDKTLSGFVVLDDEGDNYTLLDLRGGGQVWWQDHETRELEPLFASLADYLRAGEAATPDRRPASQASRWAPGAPAPSDSAALLARYQWLMQLLAQPTRDRNGQPMQTPEALTQGAYNTYHYVFEDVSEDALFNAELPALGQDVHLAIYWLLHACFCGQDARLQQVVTAVAGNTTPLLRAFVATFGALPAAADLPDVPDFRLRRATFLAWLQLNDTAPVAHVLRVLAIAPQVWGYAVMAQFQTRIARGDTFDTPALLAALDAINDPQAPAAWVVRALLQAHAGQDARASANTAAQQLASAPHDENTTLELLRPVLHHVDHADALRTVGARLLAWDNLAGGVQDLVAHAQQVTGQPVLLPPEQLAELRRLTGGIYALWMAGDTVQAARDAAPDLQDALATRLLRHPNLARTDAERTWAFQHVLAGTLPQRAALLANGVAHLPAAVADALLPPLCDAFRGPDDPLLGALLALVSPAHLPQHADVLARMAATGRINTVLRALSPHMPDARVFEPFMALLENAGPTDLLSERVAEQVSTALAIPARLLPAQLQRMADWAFDRAHQDPDNVHNCRAVQEIGAAPALEAQVRAALEVETHRLAEHPGARTLLQEALYNALARMAAQQPGLDDYLATRLWHEPARCLPLWTALRARQSPALHACVLEQLRLQPSVSAAASYAAALDTTPPRTVDLLDLALVVQDWPVPADALYRTHFKYLLRMGASTAVALRRAAHAKALHQRAEQIESDARGPQHGAHTQFTPFEDPALRAQLDGILDGRHAQAEQALRIKLEKAASAQATPAQLSIDELALLAATDAAFIWFQHPATGATLFQDHQRTLHYFNGTAIAALPFEQVPHPGPRLSELFANVHDLPARQHLRSPAGFHDWTRYGALLLGLCGDDTEQHRIALHLGSANEAEALLASIVANPLAGYTPQDPWYRPGRGEVQRQLWVRGRGSPVHLGLRYGLWRAPDEAAPMLTGAAAFAAMDAYELATYRGGGHVESIAYGTLRPHEQRLLDWLPSSFQLDTQRFPEWASATLHTISHYLQTHALLPAGTPPLVEFGPPAGASAMNALASALGHPLPAALAALWTQHETLGWQIGSDGMRLLSPQQVLAGAQTLHGETRYPLLVTAEGSPAWMLRSTADTEQQVVAASDPLPVQTGPRRGVFAVVVLEEALFSSFRHALLQFLPDLELLWYGQRGDANVDTRQLATATQFTHLRLDRDAAILATRKGKLGKPGKVKIERFATLKKAEAAFAKACKQPTGR